MAESVLDRLVQEVTYWATSVRQLQQTTGERRSQLAVTVEQLTECPICKECFDNPKMLPCRHSFCADCLKAWHAQARLRRQVICPMDREQSQLPVGGIDALPVDRTILALLEANLHQPEAAVKLPTQSVEATTPSERLSRGDHEDGVVDQYACTECRLEVSSLVWCSHCSAHLCSGCQSAHVHEIHYRLGLNAKKLRFIHAALKSTMRRSQALEDYSTSLAESVEAHIVEFYADSSPDAEVARRQVAEWLEGEMQALSQTTSALHTLIRSTEEYCRALSYYQESSRGLMLGDKDLTGLDEEVHQLSTTINDSNTTTICISSRITFSSTVSIALLCRLIENFGDIFTIEDAHLSLSAGSSVVGSSEDASYVSQEADEGRNIYENEQVSPDNVGEPQEVPLSPSNIQLFSFPAEDYRTHYGGHDQLAGRRGVGMKRPNCIAISPVTGKTFVSDTDNSRIIVLHSNGQFEHAFGVAGSGSGAFDHPIGLTLTRDGLLLVADNGNHRVQVFRESGAWIRSIKMPEKAEPKWPTAVTVDSDDNVYVASCDRILLFTLTGDYISKFGGLGKALGRFNGIMGMTYANDRLVVADMYNNRIQVFSQNGRFSYSLEGNELYQCPWGMTTTRSSDEAREQVVVCYETRIVKFAVTDAGILQTVCCTSLGPCRSVRPKHIACQSPHQYVVTFTNHQQIFSVSLLQPVA